jgi:hypothetical protein
VIKLASPALTSSLTAALFVRIEHLFNLMDAVLVMLDTIWTALEIVLPVT